MSIEKLSLILQFIELVYRIDCLEIHSSVFLIPIIVVNYCSLYERYNYRKPKYVLSVLILNGVNTQSCNINIICEMKKLYCVILYNNNKIYYHL